MESYFEDTKKYNKILYKYLYPKKEIEYSLFIPEHPVAGNEIVRWVAQKILHNPKEGMQIKIATTQWKHVTHVFIQEWYDITKPDGFVNVVHWKEKNKFFNTLDVDKEELKEELLSVSHRAMYNACVDYIIKTT